MLRLEGSTDVLKELLERKRNGKDHRKTRIALAVLGGVQRGVVGVGILRALAQAGLTNMFDVCVGTSAGAAALAYFLAGQSGVGVRIHTIDAVDPRYARMGPRGPRVNTGFLIGTARKGPRRLDVRALRRNPSAFLTDVTDFQTGEEELIDAMHGVDDPITAVHASMMMPPPIDFGELFIGDRRYVDGAIANPFPIRRIVDMFRPTHILVVTNQPRLRLHPYMTDYVIPLLPWWPAGLKRAAGGRVETYKRGVKWLQSQQKMSYGLLWGGEEVKMFEKRLSVLKKAERDAFSYTKGLLARAAA